jgi:hypothetical protein
MAEINKQDIISDEAIEAPLQLSKNILVAVDSLGKLIKVASSNKATVAQADSTAKLTKETNNLSLAQQELIKVQKQIAVAQVRDNENYQTALKTLKAVKDATKEKNAVSAEAARLTTAETASVVALEAALKKNREAYKNLAGEEERASKSGQELLRIIQQQDASVKQLNASTGKFQDNVGNYPKQFLAARDSLQQIAPAQVGFVTNMYNMVKASLAFIATPVGLVLAAIAGALVTVGALFKAGGEGEDRMAKASSQLAAIMDNLSDLISAASRYLLEFSKTAIGSAILSLIKLAVNFNPVVLQFKIVIAMIDRIVPSFREAAKVAGELADELDSLEDAQRQYNIEAAKTENDIKRLIIESKNLGLTEAQRQEKLQQALDLEIELNEKAQLLAQRKLAYEVKSAENSNRSLNLQQRNNESLEEYAKRLSDNNSLVDETKDKIAEALKNIDQVRGESLNLQEKIANAQEKLSEKEQARLQKEADEEAKRLAKEQDEYEKNLADFNKRTVDAEKKKHEELLKEQERYEKERNKNITGAQKKLDKQVKDQAAEEKKLGEEKVKFDARITDLRLQIAGSYVNTAATLIAKNIRDENTAKDIKKAAAVIEIGINLERELAANAVAAAANPLNAVTFGAAGASQLAVADALSIARAIGATVAVLAFAKGTQNAPGGPALVSEEGQELMEVNGKYSLTPKKASVIDVPKGAKIWPHDETMRILALASLKY